MNIDDERVIDSESFSDSDTSDMQTDPFNYVWTFTDGHSRHKGRVSSFNAWGRSKNFR